MGNQPVIHHVVSQTTASHHRNTVISFIYIYIYILTFLAFSFSFLLFFPLCSNQMLVVAGHFSFGLSLNSVPPSHSFLSWIRSPPNPKRFKTSLPSNVQSHLIPQQQIHSFPGVLNPFEGVPIPQAQMQSGSTSRKRRSSPQSNFAVSMAAPVPTSLEQDPNAVTSVPETTRKKKGRTNTPWTAEEEQRLKSMRDAGRSWNEIAKVRQ